MLRLRRLLAVLLLSASCLLVVSMPAEARSTEGDNPILGNIAGEFAKAGAKAAIAHFAPGLSKHVDPTSAALAQISDQLKALDAKLNQLRDYQASAEHHINCSIKQTHLNTILASADTELQRLIGIGNIALQADRAQELSSLAAGYYTLTSQQKDLHLTVGGTDGLLVNCAKYIETQMWPFLTSRLAPTVRDFYAAYHAAALAILTVRVNIANLYPNRYEAADHTIKTVEHQLAAEAALIKPAMPSDLSYYKDHDLVFRTRGFRGLDASNRTYQQNGWWVTNLTTVPTCTMFQWMAQATKLRGSAAVGALASRNVIHTESLPVRCFDDHDRSHLFDLSTFTYTGVGYSNLLHGIAFAARRPHHGELAHWSYVLG